MASSVPNAGSTLDQAKIAGVRQAWMQAVVNGDANRLTNFVTDDVVAVWRDGRCICGKHALQEILQHVFGLYDVERKILSSRVVTRDQLAIELDEMESTMTQVGGGMEIHAQLKIVIVYGRQTDGGWKITRLMEFLD